MGAKRKMAALGRALDESRAETRRVHAQLMETQSHTWALQMVCAAVIEHLTENGAVVLPLELRKRVLEGEWGIETRVLPDEREPMIVRVMKNQAKPAGGGV